MQIHSNGQRKNFARQAAVTGLTVAIRRMSLAHGFSEEAWSGVGSSFELAVTATERVAVQYLAPDPSLVARFPDEPYLLVRIVATGSSTEPGPMPVSTTIERKRWSSWSPGSAVARPPLVPSAKLYPLSDERSNGRNKPPA